MSGLAPMSACGAKRCSEQPLQVWAFRYGIGEFAVARRHRSHVINRILSESRSPPCGCALLFQMHLSRIAQVTPPCNKKRRAQLSVRPAESAVGDSSNTSAGMVDLVSDSDDGSPAGASTTTPTTRSKEDPSGKDLSINAARTYRRSNAASFEEVPYRSIMDSISDQYEESQLFEPEY